MDWKEYEAGELVRQLLQSCTIRDGEILRFHGEGEDSGEMVKLLHPRLKAVSYTHLPAPPKPLMIAQVLQPIQVFTFSPSMGQWRLLNGLPASNTAIFNPGFF